MAKKDSIKLVALAAFVVALLCVHTYARAQEPVPVIDYWCEMQTPTGPRDGQWVNGVCVFPAVFVPVVAVQP